MGLLGLIGILLLCISYRHRKLAKRKEGRSVNSAARAGIWLKYDNKPEHPIAKALGGEIFLRNLEEKHGLRGSPNKHLSQDRTRTGWSKYFSTSWYHSGQNQRESVSTNTTGRALVNETRDQTGSYDGGWDAESRYSKASSFVSFESRTSRRDSSFTGRWSGIRWSYNKKMRASNASSGVLGSTLSTAGPSKL